MNQCDFDTTTGNAPASDSPLRFGGGNLGLICADEGEPIVCIVDEAGRSFVTSSVEFILQHIDNFYDDRDRMSLLAAAALHYGFEDVWTLIDGRNAKPAREAHDRN
jgi:hypothetical protein